MPEFPPVKEQYVFVIDDMVFSEHLLLYVDNREDISLSEDSKYHCIKFDIVNYSPYRLKYVGEVSIQNCHLVGGFNPTDMKLVTNWISEVQYWYSQYRNKCLK